ncbi:MAG: hypothetical protein WCW44_00615 [archaeon]|jgi:hypothetical protein
MDEKTLSRICLGITLIGMLILLVTYKTEFEEKTATQLLLEENGKGILFGRIEHIIQNYPTTIFVLNDGNETLIYYPKKTTFEKGQFVEVYAENRTENTDTNTKSKNKKQNELFAQKVIEK